jgi:hypothetical protein
VLFFWVVEWRFCRGFSKKRMTKDGFSAVICGHSVAITRFLCAPIWASKKKHSFEIYFWAIVDKSILSE